MAAISIRLPESGRTAHHQIATFGTAKDGWKAAVCPPEDFVIA
jgi:hypothetical protein